MASIAAGEERMRASHIPIYHEGSRCEESWKDPEDQVISSTTRADAAVLLDELHDQILTDHASFADLAAQHSARPSASGLRQRAECGQQHRNAVLISDGEISMIADCYHGISFVDLKLLRRHTKILM